MFWAWKKLRRPPRLGILLAGALVCTSGCETAGTEGVGERPAELPTNGPVQFVEGEIRQTAGILASGGDRVVFGATSIVNSAETAVVLEGAELLGPVTQGQAKVVAVRVVDLGRVNNTLVGAAKWPFENYGPASEPLAGYRLESNSEVELLFVVEIAQTGQWQWESTSVVYESDSTRYRETSPFGFAICPASEAVCPTRA